MSRRRFSRTAMRAVLLSTTLFAGSVTGGVGAKAGQLPIAAFSSYTAANYSTIVPGPFALYSVSLNSLKPTQVDEGLAEVYKKAAGIDLLAPSQLQAYLLGYIEPVVIGPGGQLYLTDGQHTFTALSDSIYGASNPTVFVNVIANYSNLTMAQFYAQMQANQLLLPLSNGVASTVNPSTGAPIPASLTTLVSDVYRGLEYAILKNKSSKLYPTTSNLTGAVGASIPGLDKMTGAYTDFLEAAAYRGANGGLGLPYLTPSDIALATKWNLTANSTTTIPNVLGTVYAYQLPGFILSAPIVNAGGISNATLANGAMDGNGTFTGITQANLGTAANPVLVGTPNVGFIMELGYDANKANTVTLNGTNTYTGGTSILAGNLVAASDASLGAVAPVGYTINPNAILSSVQAANGIVFNSLTEGGGTLTLGTTTGQTLTLSRPIAVDGETATINVNDNTVTLNGQLVSLGTSGVGIGNTLGVSDITFDDLSAAGTGKIILGTASPYFYGNLIIGNSGSPTVEVLSDAAMGATTGSQIGQVELNGGTFQLGANITATERNFFLGGGSSFDVNGFTGSFGSLSDTQRTLEILNSNTTTAGSATFTNLVISATASLQLAGGTAGETVTFTDGISRTAQDTLILYPTNSSSLGTTEKVFSSGASATLVNGIAPAWIVTNNGTNTKSAGPYDFVTYGVNGYVKATYTNALSSATASNVVELTAATTTSGGVAAYALNTNGKTLNLGGGTLTLGDGTAADAAGLILASGSAISNGTLAFGKSEGVIWLSGSNPTISAQITGSNGLTFAGSGSVAINTAANVTGGVIQIDSGTVTLGAVNVFSTDIGGIAMSNTKTKPAPATLNVNANNTLTTLNTVGSNSTVNIGTGVTLTLGDTTNNLSSTINSVVKSTGAANIVLAGSGLFDFSGGGSSALNLFTGSTITVDNSAQFRVVSNEFTNAINIVLNGTSQLQLAQNGGGALANNVSGTGELHLIGGTVQLTGTNTYTGGTVIELGSTLTTTTANLPTGGNIINAGGLLDFDQTTSGTFTGVMSDGLEMGTGPSYSGSLVKDDSTGNNSGNVTLAAVQTYTGPTYVEAGTLTLGAVNAIASSDAVILGRVGGNSNAILALGANNAINNLNSNPGSLADPQTTAVTLGGYTLTLNGGTTSAMNDFQGNITGPGALVINGAQELDGQNTPTTTTVNGTLDLGTITYLSSNATLAGTTTVSTTGLLAGVGSAATVINNGTVNALNGLSVTGNYTQTGTGTLQVQATPGGGSTTLVVGGTATLAGSLGVALTANPTAYSFGQRYVAVAATGGVSGQLSNVGINNTADFVTSQDATHEYYTFNQISTVAQGSTLNEIAVGHALDKVIAAGYGSNNANLIAVVNAVNEQNVAQTIHSQTSLSGEGYGGFAAAGIQAVHSFGNAVLNALGFTASGPTGTAQADSPSRMMVASVDPNFVPTPGSHGEFGVWASAYGQTGHTSGDGNTHSVNTTVGGGAIGADKELQPGLLVGMAFGYGGSDFSLKSEGDRGHADNGQFALYAGLDLGNAYVNGSAGAASYDGTLTRNVSLVGLNNTATGTSRGLGGLAAVEAGLRYNVAGMRVAPFLAVQADAFNQNSSQEQSSSTLALKVAGLHRDSVMSTLGARVASDLEIGGQSFNTELKLGWSHEFADVATPVSASFVGQPGAGFTIASASSQRDHAVVGLGVSTKISASTSAFLRYDGNQASGDSSNAVQGGVRFNF